ncbi:MAG: FHA domain-containing protein [Deltaproteobacteria bacterium]|nr:FHA domain-containing protein [Deltaproteobacteria bacterium]
MFALEIKFNDGISQPEVLLVRRQHVVIGASDYAHVVIEGFAANRCDLKLTRGLGRQFRCQPIIKSSSNNSGPLPFAEGVYSGDVELELTEVSLHITALDVDLQLQSNESPDRAGVRILRQALSHESPVFPAVSILGAASVMVSFPEDEPLIIGRSRKCGLRLDAADVSSEQARIGFERGGFWIEDLGSKNGSFVEGRRVNGRQSLKRDSLVTIGSEFVLQVIKDQDDLAAVSQAKASGRQLKEEAHLYPCLVSSYEAVQPRRLVLLPGLRVTLGRDPCSDIWIEAAHVSRNHAEINYSDTGVLSVTDLSSNGTSLNGQELPAGKPVELSTSETSVLDLGMGVEISLCFSEADEAKVSGASQLQSAGLPWTAVSGVAGRRGGDGSDSIEVEDDRAIMGQVSGGESGDEPTLQRARGAFEDLVQRAQSVRDANISGLEARQKRAGEVLFSGDSSSAVDMTDGMLEENASAQGGIGRLGQVFLWLAVVVLALVVAELLIWFVGGSRLI